MLRHFVQQMHTNENAFFVELWSANDCTRKEMQLHDGTCYTSKCNTFASYYLISAFSFLLECWPWLFFGPIFPFLRFVFALK